MKKIIALVAAATLLSGTALMAEGLPGPVKARQGSMNIIAINLGILGGIAKGQIEYSEELAMSAANSLAGISMVAQTPLFPAGTSASDIDGTRAKSEIWDNFADYEAKWASVGTAAAAMQVAAASGKDAIGPALGQLGGTCKACHQTYRAPAN
jgi:cytochrome c556